MRTPLSRLLLLVLLTLFLVFVVSPGIIGLSVRDATVRRAIELFPPEASQQLVFQETGYDRGWFRSSGSMEVQYAPFGALGERVFLEVPYEVSHGPLIATEAGYRLGLAQARLHPVVRQGDSIPALRELPFALPQSLIEVLTGFDQSTTVAFAIEPVNYQGDEGEFVFEGLSATLVAYADRSADLSLNMGLLRATEPESGVQLELGGLSAQTHSEQLDNLLAPASARFNIDRIRSTGITPLTIASVSGDSQITPSAAGPDRIDIAQTLTVVGVDSAFPVERFQWSWEFRELRTEIARSYLDLSSEFQRQMDAGAVGGASVAALGRELGMSLLRNRLILVNEMEASAYQGEHDAQLDIDWSGLPQLQSMQQVTPAAIVEALDLRLDVSLDLAAVQRSPYADLVNAYAQAGYLRIENGRVSLSGALGDGELSLNGDTIALDQFIVQ